MIQFECNSDLRLPWQRSIWRTGATAFVLAVTAFAQSEQSTNTATDTTNLPAQRIGASDLLNVSVYGVPSLSRSVRVSNDGDIVLPMVDQSVRAEGLLPRDLAPVIAKAFQGAEILTDPIITVTVLEYKSRPVTVSGAVKKPITFQAIGKVTLLDAIARADGLSADAGSEILVTHPGQSSEAAPQRISVKQLMSGSEPQLNLALEGGEDVRIPEVGKVFVLGNVKKPGAVRVEDTDDTSVLKILAMSEGLMPFASKVAYIYRREGDAANKTEIPIELNKIIERKSSDVRLQASDILYIPDDKHRRMTVNTLDRLATFGAGTASGVLIWRR